MDNSPDPLAALADHHAVIRLLAASAPARSVQDGGGRLMPGPDAKADAEIDRIIWATAMIAWERTGDHDAAADQRFLLSNAVRMWQASGRGDEQVGHGLHPVQQLLLERMGIIASRAATGMPLAPELDEDPADVLARLDAQFSLAEMITGLLSPSNDRAT